MAANILSVMQQLKATQEELKASEAKCSALEEENRQLKKQIRLGDVEGGSKLQEKSDAMQSRGSVLLKKESTANENLLSELRLQLTECMSRNIELESQNHEEFIKLRRQYESHIDALELELRRAKALVASGRQPSTGRNPSHSPASSSQAPSSGGNASFAHVGSRIGGASPLASSAGRTADSRRNLL